MHNRSFKRLGKNKKYYYFSRQGKRISKLKYYSRLKARRSTIHQEKYQGKYANGQNFSKKVKFFLSKTSPQTIIASAEKFFTSVLSRFKRLKHAMYFNFKGTILLDTGERELLERNTKRSFVEEFKNQEFRIELINDAVQSMYDLLNSDSVPYNLGGFPEEIILQRINIHQRNEQGG